jgi:hypothetical protein
MLAPPSEMYAQSVGRVSDRLGDILDLFSLRFLQMVKKNVVVVSRGRSEISVNRRDAPFASFPRGLTQVDWASGDNSKRTYSFPDGEGAVDLVGRSPWVSLDSYIESEYFWSCSSNTGLAADLEAELEPHYSCLSEELAPTTQEPK